MGVLAFCAASYAAAAEGLSKDEQKLEQSSSDLDKRAAAPEGQKAVESRLKSEYKVDDARVQGLRGQRLGYGEISIVLALAEKMPGGITDANVQSIMSQRQGPPVMGWGRIAAKHNVKLGKLIGKVKGVDAAARKQEKAENKGREKKAERAEKAGRPEKAERPERVERHENRGGSRK
ncbi:MAG TPA: hypothetical protein DCM05_09940 [Elusimicrobia bacterium]|nr:hypothetical protein [Elusimicrobiota bacterium]